MTVFTKKEISYMTSLGLNLDFKKFPDFSSEDLQKIMDTIENRLMFYGFDRNDNPTPEGMLCEDIITKITAHVNW